MAWHMLGPWRVPLFQPLHPEHLLAAPACVAWPPERTAASPCLFGSCTSVVLPEGQLQGGQLLTQPHRRESPSYAVGQSCGWQSSGEGPQPQAGCLLVFMRIPGLQPYHPGGLGGGTCIYQAPASESWASVTDYLQQRGFRQQKLLSEFWTPEAHDRQ